MQFLRTAFWVVIAVALAFFCMANYVPVTVRLWGDMVMETKLPVLLIGAFLLGALPFWVMARATRWRMKRRLDSTERALIVATTTPTYAGHGRCCSHSHHGSSATALPTVPGAFGENPAPNPAATQPSGCFISTRREPAGILAIS